MTGLRELVEAVREARRVALARPGRDGQADAAAATLEAYLLDTPDVLAAVEAVRRLGHWRNVLAVIDPNSPLATVSIVQARTERDRAYESLEQLADRLAARKGE